MKIKTKFKDLFLIKNKSYKDNRGSFREVIKEKSINKRFPLVLTSYSKYNVTRGLHLQTKNPQSMIFILTMTQPTCLFDV